MTRLPDDDSDISEPELHSGLSITAQAAFATNLAEQAVNDTHPVAISEIASSLNALRRLLEVNGDVDKTKDSPRDIQILPPPSDKPEDFPLPPIQLTMTALQKLKGG
jgi:hypothetical protein